MFHECSEMLFFRRSEAYVEMLSSHIKQSVGRHCYRFLAAMFSERAGNLLHHLEDEYQYVQIRRKEEVRRGRESSGQSKTRITFKHRHDDFNTLNL